MESVAFLRSFHYSVGRLSYTDSLIERPKAISTKLHFQGFAFGGRLASFRLKQKETSVACATTAKTTVPAKDGDNNPLEKSTAWSATFPSGFEALVLEVCDETEVAELKLKVGDFEMNLKRNIGATNTPAASIPSPTTPPPIPTEPMTESSSTSPPPPAPPKPSLEKSNPFVNVSLGKSSKLEALEASGATGYVVVPSPTVGSFRRGRTLKGKKQPPICKEGDVIKEGQVIGYLDQFGSELPVKSNVAGEVLKLLVNDGEAIGYGGPLIAVLPSFHGIK